MKLNQKTLAALALGAATALSTPSEVPAQALNRNPKLTWHWHVHQPIYWNGQNRLGGADRYEYAWDSIQMKNGGNPHPTSNLEGIFGLADRIAAYQYRMRDALGTIGDHTKSGAVVSYSGALMQNVRSLGLANQLGYSPGWKNGLQEANTWTTTNGYSRLEFTNFSFHHGLSGLLPDEANFMSIRLQQEIIRREFGDAAVDKGFFPTEMTWSKRLIPVLKRLGIEWSIVSGEHIARACPDFPIEYGQGGIGCDPPNRADKINPNGDQFIRITIQRGVSPVNANPLSFQPAYQKWVNPETGAEEKIIVVPADQSWGWLEGYGQINARMLDDLEARNNPNQPSLVLMSHDGDNAYAGGFSYYMENLRNLANDARNRGGEAVSVSQYLHDFPPPQSNVIHVEDGGWVNADGDFGSPVYINWNYPLLDATGTHDPANGWHEKVREMALFHEVVNRILTAEQLTPSYTRNFAKILEPDASTHPIDRAWHYYLGSFDSGNVYYGNIEDFSIKGTLGARKVDELIGGILTSGAANDQTPPTIFVPQRHPYNPGSLNFGVAYASSQYQGRRYINDGDFTIWTFVADVSGPPTAVLKYRIDSDGTNPLASNQNETFAGGAEVGQWVSIPMTGRQFPLGDVFNKSDVNYRLIGSSTDLLPNTMPWHFHAEVNDLRSTLIDYYVEATDSRGNVSRSPIQHVYIGDGSGATGGGGGNGNEVVTISPNPAVRGQNVTVTYNAQGRNLATASPVYMHYGKNNYAGGAVAPDATMTNAGSGLWTYTYTVPADATTINMVFNNGSGTWDNNGGANWNFSAIADPGNLPPTAAFAANPVSGNAPLNVTFTDQSTNSPTEWAWDFNNDGTVDSTQQSPSFNYTAPGTYSVKLTAANENGSDEEVKTNLITVAAVPTEPTITLNKTTITATTSPGTNPAADSFTVRNTGGGTLNYNVSIAYDGAPPAPTVNQVLSHLNNGGSATGLDANLDGKVDVADLIKSQLGITTPTWLAVNPNSGTATSETDTINVTYNAASLIEGTYNATITVEGNSANSPRTIPVTVNVAAVAPPTIGLSATSVTQSAAIGGSANNSTFTVSNSGGGSLSWTGSLVDLGDGIGWLSVAPGNGESTGAPQTVTVTYNLTGLAAGEYRARYDIVAAGATNTPQSVTITLTVLDSIPTTTTVVPNPPVAGQSARVWYATTAGPLSGRAAYNLHWGINGGTVAGGSWQSITTTPLVNGQQSGMWYADITIPQAATSLNFVFNDNNNNWDNNGEADWNFVVTPANVGNAVMSLAPTTVSVSSPQGGSSANRTLTLGNTGDASLTWTSTVEYQAAAKSTAKATGTRKTITVDGSNTAGEWTTNELVATAPAWDHANVVGGNWSTHETQFDYTALFAAWDANNLYVGIQVSDVVDIEDPANAGSSQGTAPTQMNLPQFIAINTRAGGYGAPTVLSDMWTKAHGFAGTDQPDYQVYFASNFWQGPFVCEYKGGWNPDVDAYGPAGQIYRDAAGLTGRSAKADAGAPIIGAGGKNYRTLNTNTSRQSFFEVAIPLNLIGNPDLDNAAIGIFVGHGEGFSGVDTIPKDPAATNTPGVSNSNSPNEWEDSDTYSVPFAQVGAGETLGGGQNWLSLAPSQGTVAAGANSELTLTVNPEGLEPGVYTADVVLSGNATNSPATATVTLTVTGAGTDPVIQLNKTTITATTAAGSDAASQTFTIRNSGAGTLDYMVAKDDAPWLTVAPSTGTSTGEADTITVNFDTDTLAVGNYDSVLTISGNGTNSPQTVAVDLTVQSAIPSTTTVVPNPPVAGATARVWYASSGGPIASRAAYNLHWGINGGPTGGGEWVGVTSTPLTNAQQGGMWYADISIPANATSLNFVFNDNNNNWDNNGGANWNFATAVSSNPLISVSSTTVNATANVGTTPANSTFTVRNGGAGTLDYTITKVDTGDGVAFLNVSPASGASTGESDTVTISWNTTGLAAGTYVAGIQIAGNATNSPAVVTATLNIGTPQPVVRPITIGRGPALGTNTEGTQYFEEFQDWNAGDLRALDTNDATALNDGYDMARDVVAFYSRFENNNLYLRTDFLELGILAEQGNLDVYVLIDCAAGGVTTLPNGIGGNTTDAWDLAVATYDAVNFGVIRSNGQAVTGAHLGAYFRSDLDSAEFGVTQQALRDAGWNGTSPGKFMVITGKDFGTSVTDNIGFPGGIPSTNATGRAKFATIAHGNQSLNRGDSMRDRIYKSAASTGVGAPSGFRLTLDTHRIFQIPINIHMSATLIMAIHWIEDANPVWDGDAFINYVGTFVDEDQTVDPGAKIGGVFSEHIMPFFVGQVNLNSIERFDDMTRTLWGIDGSDMKVMHVPERVINSKAAGAGRDVFDDIVDSPYTATYLDEVAHIRNWLYPNDPWTGIGGEYGVPRQHKIMLINGVYTFQINDNEDQYKFWPQDGGANMNWKTNLLWKALDTDQEQLTLIFDDWEALAGYSFGSGYNNNAVQYNDVMRWVANKPWIEVVTLKEILDRATNTAHPKYSANWVVTHGDIGDKPFDTYDYLHHATQDSYVNWYNGSAQEESFRNAVPVTSGVVGNGTPMPSGKVFGELGTTGTIIHDTWAAVQAAPSNSVRRLAERAYQAMIYETAWHDEDNTNYERTAASNYKQWAFPDTTYDKVSGWAFTLHNHLRGVTITTAAAQWVETLRAGTRPAGVSVSSVDLDQDGEVEYVLANERIWMAFERRGGRCVQAYYYDPTIQDGISFIGTSPINNPSAQGEEEGTTNASRCSGFKEMNQGVYADVLYTAATGSSSVTFTSPNGQVIKTISLTAGSNVITASYTNNTGADLFVRMGVSVNNLDLLDRGQNFTSNYTTNTFTQTNNTRGALTITGAGSVGVNQLDTATRFVIPLTEQMEVRVPTGTQSFTLTVPN